MVVTGKGRKQWKGLLLILWHKVKATGPHQAQTKPIIGGTHADEKGDISSWGTNGLLSVEELAYFVGPNTNRSSNPTWYLGIGL
ncbi:hypothetical protein VNO77_25125 [Canavalia gladiata]|uniref:Uncharacterized protein n=1 Tax=Canavalia gladiata TaxID=3824 RepID=A0AAN9QDB6_CANGL